MFEELTENILPKYFQDKEAIEEFRQRDKDRDKTAVEIHSLLKKFLIGEIDFKTFKIEMDGTSKHENLWGFGGTSGQMFLNQLFLTTEQNAELREHLLTVLKDVLVLPEDLENAKKKIRKFIDITETIRDSRENKRSIRGPKSALYFLSFFWHIQDNKFPVVYYSLKRVFENLGYLTETDSPIDYFENYYNLVKKLEGAISQKLNINIEYRDVEHIIYWYWLGLTIQKESELVKTAIPDKIIGGGKDSIQSYLPPIVSDIVEVSKNEKTYHEFEEKTAVAFTMLGFEVQKLGQGKGRVTDVIAFARTSNEKMYHVLIDCKERNDGSYSISSGDERAIIDYIKSFNRRRESKGTDIFYVIISSGFKSYPKDAVKRIQSEVGFKNLTLIPANLILELLSLKLTNPTVDVDTLKIIFNSEILTKNDIYSIIE